MEKFVGVLLDNYIYIAIVAGFLILALLGYIIDTTKTEKLKKEFSKEKDEVANIPVAQINSVPIVNQTTTQNIQPVNNDAVNNLGYVPPVALNARPIEAIQNEQNNI